MARALTGKLLTTGCTLALTCALASSQTMDESAASRNRKHAGSKSNPSAKSSHARKSTAHAGTAKKSRTASSHPTSKKGKKSTKTASLRRRGQQKIDSRRALQIQQALVREHYLSGTPTGNWDASAQKAMEKYQADHGWQSKVVPDSRALIQLGLGPNHDHLLNPESAMTTTPPVSHTSTTPPAADPSSSGNQPQR